MNRQEAIDTLAGIAENEIGEFCIGDMERSNAVKEFREAMKALGVTDAELDQLMINTWLQ